MSNADVDYLERRFRQEQAAALAATDPRVAASHADMARRYEAAMKHIAADEIPLLRH